MAGRGPRKLRTHVDAKPGHTRRARCGSCGARDQAVHQPQRIRQVLGVCVQPVHGRYRHDALECLDHVEFAQAACLDHRLGWFHPQHQWCAGPLGSGLNPVERERHLQLGRTAAQPAGLGDGERLGELICELGGEGAGESGEGRRRVATGGAVARSSDQHPVELRFGRIAPTQIVDPRFGGGVLVGLVRAVLGDGGERGGNHSPIVQATVRTTYSRNGQRYAPALPVT